MKRILLTILLASAIWSMNARAATPEICGDGVDNDSSGGDAACKTGDADMDGYCASGYTGCYYAGTDCDDSNRLIYPGTYSTCGTDGTRQCQTSGSYTGCTEGELNLAQGSGNDYFIDPVSGNDTNNGLTRATAWQNLRMISSYYDSPGSAPSGHHELVDGDRVWLMSGNYTYTYDFGQSCGGAKRCSKQLQIKNRDCPTYGCFVGGYPGQSPVLKVTVATDLQNAHVYLDGSDNVTLHDFTIDGQGTNYGHGVNANSASSITLSRVTIKNIGGLRDNLGGFTSTSITNWTIDHSDLFDVIGTDGAGAGDCEIVTFNVDTESSVGKILFNLVHNTAEPPSANASQCIKPYKHAGTGSYVEVVGNRMWNCGEDYGISSGGPGIYRNNLIANTMPFRFADLGGDSHFVDNLPDDDATVVFQNNTVINMLGSSNGQIAYYPHKGYDDDGTGATDICSGTNRTIGKFRFTENNIKVTGTSATFLEMWTFGPDSIFTDVITGGKVLMTDNAYERSGGLTYDIFSSNNGDTSCSGRGNNGQTYANFAAWQSAGYDSGSSLGTIAFNSTFHTSDNRGFQADISSTAPTGNGGAFSRGRGETMKKTLIICLLLIPSVADAATLVTRYVRNACTSFNGDGTSSSCASSGGGAGAYNDFKSANDDINSDYPNPISSDVQIDLNCDDGGSTDSIGANSVTVSNGNTDATRYVRIFAAPGARCRVSGGFGNGLVQISGVARLEGLELSTTLNDSDAARGIWITAQDKASVRITGNIISYDPSGTATTSGTNAGIYVGSGNAPTELIIANNIIKNFRAYSIYYDNTFTATPKIIAYNNTIQNGNGVCIHSEGGAGSDARYVKNNVLSCAGNDWTSGSAWTTSTTAKNITADATSPDGASYQSKTCTFVGSGDYHLSASDTNCKEAGDDLSADAQYAFSIDIDGATRSGTWDIGADELSSSTPTFSVFNAMGEL